MALVGIIASVVMFVLGGPELRTIISGKMDPSANFVFSWVDGGAATLRRYHQFEHGVMEGDKEFLLYATPLSDVQYDTTVSFEQARKMVPQSFTDEVVRQMVESENAKRRADDARKNGEMPVLNEAAKGQCHFAGKPCWIGHRSIGIAMQPTLVEELQKNRRKIRNGSKQASFYAVGVDTIKDFVAMNFSPKRLFQIWRSGEDAGLHGRPKKPFPMIIVLVALGALVFIVIGGLIISGQVDLGGFVKGLGIK